MIIGRENDIHNADGFIRNLAQVLRGLVMVSTETSGNFTVSSGWLLTDTLVVVPDYVAATSHRFLCRPYSEFGEQTESIEALLVTAVPEKQDGSRPALLKLSTPLPGCALKLETRTPAGGDLVAVLQHPNGTPVAHFSLGNVTGIDEAWLTYNASTSPGASGGPVISVQTWKIVGMHAISMREDNNNKGLRIDPILDGLRDTGEWAEIVKHHNLAESAYTTTYDPVTDVITFTTEKFKYPQINSEADDPFLKAALSWSFDPNKIMEGSYRELQPMVIDANASAWTLKSSERQRILRSAGSVEKLKEQMPENASDETGQAVIKNILENASHKLEDITEEELPYWLQAVRWFDGVIPDLPSPAEINKAFERKRTRSKLLNIISGFRGRKTELDQLIKWYNDAEAGPMLITGIGGMGKSALVGYFAYNLPSDTMLLWLDFDRPDIAPDDAVSVLNSIAEQASVQLDDFSSPEITEENWKEAATEIGLRLAKATENTQPSVMIMDGFEVAQHAKEYHEIWQLLELVLAAANRLKVIVSGRAPVRSLKLKGKEATPMPLKGLEKTDAETWLRERGINNDEVLGNVLELAQGVPLRLKLAVRLIESGEKVEALPENFQQALIEGYLYQRILNRVIDPLLIPIVKDILVLRKCSKPMLVEILGNNVPEGLTAEQVYDRLSREMALVGDAENLYASFVVAGNNADKLELRPEVRSATLRLLEQHDAAQVKAMDQKGADWYAKQDLTDVHNVAELVYHLLRLQKLDEARKVFRIECAPLLLNAENDLPENANAERIWLEKKVGGINDSSDDLSSWEISIALDIRNRLSRGITRDIDNFLSSRKQRTAASPLLVYDAWNCFSKGELQNAISILKYADKVEGPVQRDRNVLHAFLLLQAEDWMGADELLQEIEDIKWWSDRSDAENESLAVRAARVRLTVDIDKELKLLELLKETSGNPRAKDFSALASLKQFLTPSDIVTPLLNDLFANQVILESYSSALKVPFTEEELPDFRRKLQDERFASAPFAISLEDNVSRDSISKWRQKFLPWKAEEFTDDLFNLGFELAYKGYRRWKFATSNLILADLCKIAVEKREQTPLSVALIGALPAFRGQQIHFTSISGIDNLLQLAFRISGFAPPAPASLANAEQLKKYFSLAGIKEIRDLEPGKIFHQLPSINDGGDQLDSFMIYLGTPEPLEILCKRILGLPENFKLVP